MNTTGLVRYAGAVLALAICSACGSGSAVAPPNANEMLTTAAHPGLSGMTRYPTIVPDRHTRPEYFEYIINDYQTYASIFDYPKSDKQIGSITDVGGQGCTNVLHGYGKKTFWIVAGADQITEYNAPKKPLKTLSTSSSFGMPTSCAMDAAGDLAVGIFFSSGSGGGDVVIFKNANGSGTVYSTPLVAEYFDGYDPNGNLFADGLNASYNFELVELPKGSSKFETITTSNTVEFPGSVQWDGSYLTVVDQDANALYQYTVSGTKATLKGTVSFSGSGDCAQTWIATGVIFCADAGTEGGEVFKYPAGGSPVAVFSGNFDLPLGTVAVKK
jgi:hypothetical protein